MTPDIALHGFLARILGRSADRAAVERAQRSIQLAASRHAALVLCSEGDRAPIAAALHRCTLGPDAPFVACDQRRGNMRATVRSPHRTVAPEVYAWRVSAAKQIDITRILSDVPDLAQLPGVCREGWFAGAHFAAAWDGTWRASGCRSGFGFTRLNEVPDDDIVLDTAMGTLTLRQPCATNSSSDATVSGVALSCSLRLASTEVPAARFRSYARTSDLTTKVCFPQTIEDPILRSSALARLPLVLADVPVEVFTIARGPYLIIEAPAAADSGAASRFREVSGSLRLLLSYLFGVRLVRRTCDVHIDASGDVLQVDWYPGRPAAEDTIYTPIPVSWHDWIRASHTLNLDSRRGPLVPEVLSRMAQTFLDEHGLAAPVEYLLRFHEAPVEIRGALLSLALESLTDQLQKKGLFEFPKPLPDEAWMTFLGAAKALVDQQETWTDEQRDVITSRLRNLNSPTNTAKLTVPFAALGIVLTTDERDAINKRNRLLHQGRLLNPDYVRDNRGAWKDAYAIEMRILTALNKLLLAHLGYKGAVIDWGATPVDSESVAYTQI